MSVARRTGRDRVFYSPNVAARSATFRTVFLTECLGGMLACALLLSSGCAMTPSGAAKSAEQQAFAVYGTFTVMEEQAAILMTTPSVPIDAKERIQRADQAAKPLIDQVLRTALAAMKLRRTLQAGGGDATALQLATVDLERLTAQATPLLTILVTAVEGVR